MRRNTDIDSLSVAATTTAPTAMEQLAAEPERLPKSRIEQVIENLSQVAPPGEQFIACIHCETGPSPWLNMLFEEIPFAMLEYVWKDSGYWSMVALSPARVPATGFDMS